MKTYLKIFIIPVVGLCFFLSSCEDHSYTIPKGITELKNDCIKRTLGPNLVGQKIEFVYAVALPQNTGNIISAKVEASIAGAHGTYLEHRSFHTGIGGQDVGVVVASPSVNNDNITEVTFTVDTCAAALRYYYEIPEEARGGEVSFKFSAVDSNGKQVSYEMGSYKISEMDMKLDIVLSNNSYFSIADMKSYTAAQAKDIPEKIDLVYMFRTIRGVNFRHAFVSPAADSEYLPNITLPEGLTNSTRVLKVYASADQHLARNEFGVFVDDMDLREIDLTNTPDYAIDVAQNAGLWLETADGQYRAYLYVNTASTLAGGMTISMKRLKVK